MTLFLAIITDRATNEEDRRILSLISGFNWPFGRLMYWTQLTWPKLTSSAFQNSL